MSFTYGSEPTFSTQVILAISQRGKSAFVPVILSRRTAAKFRIPPILLKNSY
jgi:hypothetical protein